MNGRRVRPEQIGDALEKAVLNEAIKGVKREAGSVVCPNHGESASVVVKGKSLDRLTFEVHGCCDELVAAVQDKLR